MSLFVASQPADARIHETARRIAQRCRHLIQACLREEEWADADREFYLICREELAVFEETPERAHANRPGDTP